LRSREKLVQARVTDAEYTAFKNKVDKSGLSTSVFLRKLIKGQQPKELPPPDYFMMMRELYRIGNCLTQIANAAITCGMIDREKYAQEVDEYKSIVRQITSTVLMPGNISPVMDETPGAPPQEGTY